MNIEVWQILLDVIAVLEKQDPVAIADGTFNHNCPIGTPLYKYPLESKLLARIAELEMQLQQEPIKTCLQTIKPLTHEQRLDVIIAFEKHQMKWDDSAILIDLVEEALGIRNE